MNSYKTEYKKLYLEKLFSRDRYVVGISLEDRKPFFNDEIKIFTPYDSHNSEWPPIKADTIHERKIFTRVIKHYCKILEAALRINGIIRVTDLVSLEKDVYSIEIYCNKSNEHLTTISIKQPHTNTNIKVHLYGLDEPTSTTMNATEILEGLKLIKQILYGDDENGDVDINDILLEILNSKIISELKFSISPKEFLRSKGSACTGAGTSGHSPVDSSSTLEEYEEPKGFQSAPLVEHESGGFQSAPPPPGPIRSNSQRILPYYRSGSSSSYPVIVDHETDEEIAQRLQQEEFKLVSDSILARQLARGVAQQLPGGAAQQLAGGAPRRQKSDMARQSQETKDRELARQLQREEDDRRRPGKGPMLPAAPMLSGRSPMFPSLANSMRPPSSGIRLATSGNPKRSRQISGGTLAESSSNAVAHGGISFASGEQESADEFLLSVLNQLGLQNFVFFQKTDYTECIVPDIFTPEPQYTKDVIYIVNDQQQLDAYPRVDEYMNLNTYNGKCRGYKYIHFKPNSDGILGIKVHITGGINDDRYKERGETHVYYSGTVLDVDMGKGINANQQQYVGSQYFKLVQAYNLDQEEFISYFQNPEVQKYIDYGTRMTFMVSHTDMILCEITKNGHTTIYFYPIKRDLKQSQLHLEPCEEIPKQYEKADAQDGYPPPDDEGPNPGGESNLIKRGFVETPSDFQIIYHSRHIDQFHYSTVHFPSTIRDINGRELHIIATINHQGAVDGQIASGHYTASIMRYHYGRPQWYKLDSTTREVVRIRNFNDLIRGPYAEHPVIALYHKINKFYRQSQPAPTFIGQVANSCYASATLQFLRQIYQFGNHNVKTWLNCAANFDPQCQTFMQNLDMTPIRLEGITDLAKLITDNQIQGYGSQLYNAAAFREITPPLGWDYKRLICHQPPGDDWPEQELPGVRGNGNCSLYAFWLGLFSYDNYAQRYRDMTFNDLFGILERAILEDPDMQAGGIFETQEYKEPMIAELHQMQTNSANHSQYAEFYYKYLVKHFRINVYLKTKNIGEVHSLYTLHKQECEHQETTTKTIYISNDQNHYELYLREIPTNNEWLDRYTESRIGVHQIDCRPNLSFKWTFANPRMEIV